MYRELFRELHYAGATAEVEIGPGELGVAGSVEAFRKWEAELGSGKLESATGAGETTKAGEERSNIEKVGEDEAFAKVPGLFAEILRIAERERKRRDLHVKMLGRFGGIMYEAETAPRTAEAPMSMRQKFWNHCVRSQSSTPSNVYERYVRQLCEADMAEQVLLARAPQNPEMASCWPTHVPFYDQIVTGFMKDVDDWPNAGPAAVRGCEEKSGSSGKDQKTGTPAGLAFRLAPLPPGLSLLGPDLLEFLSDQRTVFALILSLASDEQTQAGRAVARQWVEYESLARGGPA